MDMQIICHKIIFRFLTRVRLTCVHVKVLEHCAVKEEVAKFVTYQILSDANSCTAATSNWFTWWRFVWQKKNTGTINH